MLVSPDFDYILNLVHSGYRSYILALAIDFLASLSSCNSMSSRLDHSRHRGDPKLLIYCVPDTDGIGPRLILSL
jgi:hypothetical protein